VRRLLVVALGVGVLGASLAQVTIVPSRSSSSLPIGNGVARAGVAGLLSSWAGTVGNVGAGEDDLRTYTLPANTLATDGDVLRIKAWGVTGANANTKTIKVHFGANAQTIYGSTGNNSQWVYDGLVIRTGAATQALRHYNVVATSVASNTAPTTTQDLTTALVIKVTGESSAAADNDVRLLGFTIEVTVAPPGT
jgi:hypothetical protein